MLETTWERIEGCFILGFAGLKGPKNGKVPQVKETSGINSWCGWVWRWQGECSLTEATLFWVGITTIGSSETKSSELVTQWLLGYSQLTILPQSISTSPVDAIVFDMQLECKCKVVRALTVDRNWIDNTLCSDFHANIDPEDVMYPCSCKEGKEFNPFSPCLCHPMRLAYPEGHSVLPREKPVSCLSIPLFYDI